MCISDVDVKEKKKWMSTTLTRSTRGRIVEVWIPFRFDWRKNRLTRQFCGCETKTGLNKKKATKRNEKLSERERHRKRRKINRKDEAEFFDSFDNAYGNFPSNFCNCENLLPLTGHIVPSHHCNAFLLSVDGKGQTICSYL